MWSNWCHQTVISMQNNRSNLNQIYMQNPKHKTNKRTNKKTRSYCNSKSRSSLSLRTYWPRHRCSTDPNGQRSPRITWMLLVQCALLDKYLNKEDGESLSKQQRKPSLKTFSIMSFFSVNFSNPKFGGKSLLI